MGSNQVAVYSDMVPASSKKFLDIQANWMSLECGFTMKPVCGKIIKYRLKNYFYIAKIRLTVVSIKFYSMQKKLHKYFTN